MTTYTLTAKLRNLTIRGSNVKKLWLLMNPESSDLIFFFALRKQRPLESNDPPKAANSESNEGRYLLLLTVVTNNTLSKPVTNFSI